MIFLGGNGVTSSDTQGENSGEEEKSKRAGKNSTKKSIFPARFDLFFVLTVCPESQRVGGGGGGSLLSGKFQYFGF